MYKKIAISAFPFLMLLLFSVLACFMGYGVFLLLNGAAELSRIISRVTQTLLILSIFPVMRLLQVSARDIGFVPVRQFVRQMGGGLVLGLVTLLPVLLLSYGLEITVLDETQEWTATRVMVKLLVTFLLALLISLLEEPMFRGILIAAYVPRIGVVGAIFLSSFYYALLHFIKTKTKIPVAEAQYSDSFSLLLEAFANVLRPDNLGPFWALLMVGIFLAILRARLQLSLAWCIGCHTAWVWQIKMAHKITDVNQGSDLLYLISPYDGVIGPMVAVWLTLVLCIYIVYDNTFAKIRAGKK